MSAQPTLTRLFALLAFSGFAFYAATQFQLMQESARVSGVFNLVAVCSAAFAGWRVAGSRISAKPVKSVFGVLQGMIVAVLLALVLKATAETFRLGYKTRYDDLGDATQGFFGHIAEGIQKIVAAELLVPMAIFCVVAGLGLSVIFRLLEHRRMAR
ncbi:MAG: TrgA family protein [Alphaproteobacteria bacterium]|jgi:hypothetical protein|nr:TrgA family protein [Alphaproteobacteria bacterium]